jgi:hypothetical protein
MVYKVDPGHMSTTGMGWCGTHVLLCNSPQMCFYTPAPKFTRSLAKCLSLRMDGVSWLTSISIAIFIYILCIKDGNIRAFWALHTAHGRSLFSSNNTVPCRPLPFLFFFYNFLCNNSFYCFFFYIFDPNSSTTFRSLFLKLVTLCYVLYALRQSSF